MAPKGQPTGFLRHTQRKILKNQKIIGTIEFFPEEGKYHYSGHRNCGIVYDSKQLKEKGEICPVCKRKLTLGVLKRVEDLADRSDEKLKTKSARLARFKCPTAVTLVDALPRNAAGKVLKTQLRAPFWAGRSRNI